MVRQPSYQDFSKALEGYQADNLTYAAGAIGQNPCSEIYITNNTIRADKITTGNDMKSEYKRDFDENTWTLEVPGITRDKIEVFIAGNILYVDVNTETKIRKTQVLDNDETVRSVKLDLGILTIIVDRPEKRKMLEIQ